MKRILTTMLLALTLAAFTTGAAWSAEPKIEFYDFENQLIDGEVRKPTVIFTNTRTKVRFDRLLKLKKSFNKSLLLTAKESVFK